MEENRSKKSKSVSSFSSTPVIYQFMSIAELLEPVNPNENIICKPTGGDASVRDTKNWMGAWDSKTKNCPADSDQLLISDKRREVCVR